MNPPLRIRVKLGGLLYLGLDSISPSFFTLYSDRTHPDIYLWSQSAVEIIITFNI